MSLVKKKSFELNSLVWNRWCFFVNIHFSKKLDYFGISSAQNKSFFGRNDIEWNNILSFMDRWLRSPITSLRYTQTNPYTGNDRFTSFRWILMTVTKTLMCPPSVIITQNRSLETKQWIPASILLRYWFYTRCRHLVRLTTLTALFNFEFGGAVKIIVILIRVEMRLLVDCNLVSCQRWNTCVQRELLQCWLFNKKCIF